MKNELLAVIVKEFQQVLRDRRMFSMLLVTPLLELIFLGYAVNYDIENIRTVICDTSYSTASRTFAQDLFASRTFISTQSPDPCQHPDSLIRNSEADVAIVIPSDYALHIGRGEPVSIQVLADGSNPLVGRYAQTAMDGFTTSLNLKLAQKMVQDGMIIPPSTGVKTMPLVLFNPQMKSSIFLVPGVAAMILIITTMIAPAMGIAKEKETGVLDQVLVTPLSIGTLIVGKMIPFIIFGAFNVMLILVASLLVFDVPFRGSAWIYALGTFLYLFSTLGLSMLVAAVSKTQQQSFLTSMLILMPLLMLSGVMTPIASMPWWLQPIAWASPVRFYVDVLRGVLLKGAGFYDLLLPLGMLALLGGVILSSALALFRRTL